MYLPGIEIPNMADMPDMLPYECYAGAYYESGNTDGSVEDSLPYLEQSSSAKRVRFENSSGQRPDADPVLSSEPSYGKSQRIDKNYHLVLRLSYRSGEDDRRLLQEALHIVVQKWSYAFSVLQTNSNLSKRMQMAREKFHDTMDVLDITVLPESGSTSKCKLLNITRLLSQEIDVPLERHPLYGDDANIGEALDLQGFFMDIGVLLSLIILRNGIASEVEADYMETFGVSTRLLSAIPARENRFGLDIKALERNMDIFHNDWYRVKKRLLDATESSLTSTLSTLSLGYQVTQSLIPIIWTHENSYLAVLVSMWHTNLWATVVCCTIVPEQQEPNEQTQDRQLHRRNSSAVRKAKKRKCISKFLNLLERAGSVLTYSNRGVYKVEEILLSTEHLELDLVELFHHDDEELNVKEKNNSEFAEMVRTHLLQDISNSYHPSRSSATWIKFYFRSLILSIRRNVNRLSVISTLGVGVASKDRPWSDASDPALFDNASAGTDLTRRIMEADGHLKRIKYHVDGGKLRLNSIKTFFWRAYVVGAALLLYWLAFLTSPIATTGMRDCLILSKL